MPFGIRPAAPPSAAPPTTPGAIVPNDRSPPEWIAALVPPAKPPSSAIAPMPPIPAASGTPEKSARPNSIASRLKRQSRVPRQAS